MRPKVNKGRQRTIHLNERQQDGDVVIECKHRDNRITTWRSECYRVQTVKHRQLLRIINVLLHRICTNRTLLITPPRKGSGVLQSFCLSVCLFASISLEPLDQSSRNVLCRSPVFVARSSSDGIAICYVFPVLWMTTHLALVGGMVNCEVTTMSGVAIQ